MSTELLEFEDPVEDEDGRSYTARVMGAERPGGQWVGWIEFTLEHGEAALATQRETTQPNRGDLEYWAGGLSHFYLQGALARARRRQDRTEKAPAADAEQAEGRRAAIPNRGVPRLEVESADPKLPEHVLEVVDPRPGTSLEVPDAGIVVYEGVSGGEGAPRHVFAVQYGSRNAGVTLSNWLWSRLHGKAVTVRVDGRVVEPTNHGLAEALIPPAR